LKANVQIERQRDKCSEEVHNANEEMTQIGFAFFVIAISFLFLLVKINQRLPMGQWDNGSCISTLSLSVLEMF
jgi:hypothetical protein